MAKAVGKYIGSSFLLLAVLVLFAHAFVPHHHHNHQVCIEKSACTHHTANSAHPEENDHQNEDTNQNCCALNQLVVIPNNQWKQECSCIASSNKHLHELISLVSDYSSTAVHSASKPVPPVQEKVRYSLPTPSSSQLRAPPVV